MSWVHGAVEGMRNFFGVKMGRAVLGGLSHFSPIAMHDAATAAKITSSVAGEGTGGFVSSFRNWNAMRGEALKARGTPYAWSDYFRGFNIEDTNRAGLDEGLRSRRQMTRLAFPAAFGLAMGGDMIGGPDSGIGNVGRGAMSLGGAAMMGAAAGMVGGPFAALGMTAVSATNAMRRGDQWGPF